MRTQSLHTIDELLRTLVAQAETPSDVAGLLRHLDQINKTGQLLTQQLDSEQALQATVDEIQDAAKADIVILYPYDSTLRRFVLPAIVAGTLLNSTIQSLSSSHPNNTVASMTCIGEAIFAKNSAHLL